MKELGADEVIDYTTTSVTDRVNDADAVLELAGGDATIPMLKALRKGGILISARKLPDIAEIASAAAGLDVIGSSFVAQPDYAGLEHLVALVRDGALRVEVSTVLPLENAVEALKMIPEGRLVGKTVLKVT